MWILPAKWRKELPRTKVNAKFKEAAEGSLGGYLAYVEDEIVSSDLVGDAHSCSFDSMLTSVVEDSLVKVIAWYDNEYGYASRVVDLIELVGRTL